MKQSVNDMMKDIDTNITRLERKVDTKTATMKGLNANMDDRLTKFETEVVVSVTAGASANSNGAQGPSQDV